MTDLIQEVKEALAKAKDVRLDNFHASPEEALEAHAAIANNAPIWLQQLIDRLETAERQREEAVKALEAIDSHCRKRTFKDCGDLRSVVYDIAFDTLKRIKGENG